MVKKPLRAAVAFALAATLGLLLGQGQISVGEGSPDSVVLGLFVQAFARNDFSTKVSLPPKTKVRRVGSGYVQDFNDIDTERAYPWALVKPDSLEAVFQMCCEILTLHASIGSFTGQIAYPVGDPRGEIVSAVDGTLSTQQNFEGGHAIVLHQGGTYLGQAFFVRNPYVTPWRAVPALGFPIGQERNTTSRFSTTGTQQDFQGGMIVQITSGARSGQIYTVSGPIYARYFQIGVAISFLGYPIGDEFTVSGRQRQNFEGGLVEYTPGSGLPAEARAPVASVRIDAAPLSLQVGNVVQRTAEVFDTLGNPLADRPVTWTTSNRAVIQLGTSGMTASLRAVGPGFSNVVAVADGVSSGTLRVTVTSACCQPGEGAPNAAVQRAFQEAITRNNVTPQLPTDNAVRRLGAGYVQEFSAQAPSTAGRFLVVKADSSALAFVVSGERLVRYLQSGGVVGPLGFAASDASPAGRQTFENNYAMAGSPPVLVAAPVTQKWAASGFETGAAGLPAAEAVPAGPTLLGTYGVSQNFAGGVFYGLTSGARAGQAFLVSGLILARHARLAGPAGILGLPISDPFATGGRTQQNFEGGSISFAAGDAEATESQGPRVPVLTVVPAQVAVGGRVRIALSGFVPGRTLRVSVTSQPDFEVAPPSGSFSWEQYIRQGVAPGVYRIVARDAAGNETAESFYRVRSSEEVRFQLTKASGDNQSALPGSEAAFPLVVRLTDDAGNPIANAPVRFSALAPALASPLNALTDAQGYAQARLRMPPATGLVLANAEAFGRVATFSARAEDARLTTFPAFRQGIDDVTLGNGTASIHKKGSLLTALSALFRFYQDRGELPAPVALSEPLALNQFLRADGYLPFTLNGRSELVVNLPRALAFVGDAADFETLSAQLDAIRDSLNLRRPVLVGLMLRSGDQSRGAHYVVATGVGPDGSILIHDPSPDWNRSALGEYLNGFAALGRNWTATLLHAARLRLESRSRRGFLIHAPTATTLDVQSPSGVKGYFLRIPALTAYDEDVADNGDAAQLWWVDGTATQYQLAAGSGNFSARGAAAFENLAAGVYRITPEPLAVAPQTLAASAEGLRNAAGFGPRLAPGSLVSLFGAGLSETLGITRSLPLPETLAGFRVTAGGLAAPLLFVSPFQANFQLPFGLPPGPHPLELTSAFGTARLDVVLEEAAPGIFSGAVLNQDGTLNTALNPARRGGALQVYTTGFGEVAPPVTTGAAAPPSPLSYAVAAVTATLDGQAAPVLFAGLAPGFAGLCQVNVLIPAAFPPSSAARLVIRAAGVESAPATVAVQ